MVALPNEDNFLSRIRFLQGKGILTHGLDMIDKKPGHKHQWFIQFNAASQLLKKNAKNYKFNLLNTMYFIQHPKNYLKRIVYKFLMFFVSRQTQMQCFCLVFKKDD